MTPVALHPSRISEREIAAPVVTTWRSDPATTVREDMPVTHPTEGQVAPDIVRESPAETLPNWIVVAEAKKRIGSELLNQCMRWRGFANEIWAIIETPKKRTPQFANWVHRFWPHGIGVILSNGHEFYVELAAIHFPDAKTGLLTRAIHATPDCGPPAGSQSAQRITDARRVWKPELDYLRSVMGEGVHFAEIKYHTRTRRTAAAFRKAIDEGGLPARYDGYPKSKFRYVEAKSQ